MKRSKKFYALIPAVFAFCIPSVHAQNTANGSASEGPGLEEIVVTAEKRQSNVQDTPITIQTVLPEVLQQRHIVQPSDLNTLLPGVRIAEVYDSVFVDMRGIGTNFQDPRGQGAVSISIDGLYYSRPVANASSFFDLQRVEVLEGPQGTLYGRNAAAGAINLLPNQPVQKFEGNAQVEFGNYDEQRYNAMINLPVSSDLAVRAAGQISKHDGYEGDYYDDDDSHAARLSSLWKPTDSFSALIEANYADFDGHGQNSIASPCGGVPAYSLEFPASCAFTHIGGVIGTTGHSHVSLQSYQANLTDDFGFATLTSISGFVRQTEDDTDVPLGTYLSGDVLSGSSSWSQELRLAGPSDGHGKGQLGWVVGGYYSDSSANYYGLLQPPAINFSKLPQRNEAGFGQLTYGVTDWLRLIGGLRFTHDDEGLVGNLGSSLQVQGNHLNYRAGLEADVTSHNMLYATASTGFTAGGANGGSSSLPVPYDDARPIFKPETITSYEIGSKNRFFDNRVELNGDVYYYDLHDYQQGGASILNNGLGPVSSIQNIGDLTTYGAELSVAWQATVNDKFTVTSIAAHSRFGTISYADFTGAPPAFTPYLFTSPAGSSLPSLPSAQVDASYRHTWHLPDGGTLEGGWNTNYSSSYSLVAGSTDPYDTQKSYTMSDADLDWHPGWRPWGMDVALSGWVKNLENIYVRTAGASPGFHLYTPLPPRTYGMTLSANF